MSLIARISRLEARRKRRGFDLFATRRFLDERQARKRAQAWPVLTVETLVAMLAPSGALAGLDPECAPETIEIVASMSDPNDQLRPDDPDYRSIRLARMVALNLALKPVLRSIAVERGMVDETGWPVDRPRNVVDLDIERAPETSPRFLYRSITGRNTIPIGDDQ